jgi:hypothetical protein
MQKTSMGCFIFLLLLLSRKSPLSPLGKALRHVTQNLSTEKSWACSSNSSSFVASSKRQKNKTEEENKAKEKKDKKGKRWEYKRAIGHSRWCRLDTVVFGMPTVHVTNSQERMCGRYFMKGWDTSSPLYLRNKCKSQNRSAEVNINWNKKHEHVTKP